MANVQITGGLRMDDESAWEIGDNPIVVAQTPNGFVWIEGDLTISASGYNFQYQNSGADVSAGTMTNLTMSNIKSGTEFIATGLNASMGSNIYDSGYGGHPPGMIAEIAYWLRGDDTMTGSADDDYLAGFQSNDALNGNAGTDTALYFGQRSNYTVAGNASTGYSIFSSAEGLDTLNSIEYAQFSDGTFALPSIARSSTIDNYNSSGIYRFYNQLTGTHFYTGDRAEAENVLAKMPQFAFDGLSFEKNVANTADAIDVFRFYNTKTGTHFYTSSSTEVDNIMANLPDFHYEGIAYDAHSTKSAGTTELYRFYNTQTGTHFYTADAAEMNQVKVQLAGIMNYEGIAYYVDI